MRAALFGILLGGVCSFVTPALAQATVKIKNQHSEPLVRLEASATGTTWDLIQVGQGIPLGGMVRVHIEQGAACQQHLRATFADGLSSDEILVDFCKSNQLITFDSNTITESAAQTNVTKEENKGKPAAKKERADEAPLAKGAKKGHDGEVLKGQAENPQSSSPNSD